MPVYNAAKYLSASIESILNQTFEDFEFIIINDGSSDDSEKIILSFKDPRIKYFRNPNNLKLIKTLNKGIELCSGEYIARMDADDIAAPNRLMKQFKFMEANLGIGICGTNFEIFGKNEILSKLETENEAIKFRFLYECHFQHPTLMIRTALLKENNILFNTDYVHAEDYELWVRLIPLTNFANLPDNLLKYRDHNESITNSFSSVQEKNSNKARQKLFNIIGVKVNKNELDLYRNCMYHKYPKEWKSIRTIQDIFKRLIFSNEQSRIFTPEKFKNYLANAWWNLCNNSTKFGMSIYTEYHNSELSSFYKPGIFKNLKFLSKALIKR